MRTQPCERRSRAARGAHRRGSVDRLLDVAVPTAVHDRALVPSLIERWRAAHPRAVTVYPDATALIGALRAAGTRMAIVTDNPATSQRQKLARVRYLSISRRRRADRRTRRTETRPEGLHRRRAKVGLEPREMIAIGDNPWRTAGRPGGRVRGSHDRAAPRRHGERDACTIRARAPGRRGESALGRTYRAACRSCWASKV